MDHSYQFSTQQYEVPRINEYHRMIENYSVPVVEELMTKEASEEQPSTRENADEAKAWRYARDYTNTTEGSETKGRSDLGKKDNLFIHK